MAEHRARLGARRMNQVINSDNVPTWTYEKPKGTVPAVPSLKRDASPPPPPPLSPASSIDLEIGDPAIAAEPPGALPWYALAPRALRDHVAVFGHWAAHGARVTDRIVATDSACVWGGALTAVRLDERAVFAVPAVEPPAG